MPIIKGYETTFNTVYAQYDKWRPTYVEELYRDIFAYKPIDENSKVLEIGIGTGQATLPILKMGCHLTAVELGGNLAEYSRQKFADYKNLKIVNARFEDFECAPNTYDFIYCASAFHWIPEEVGYKKVFDCLKSGGVFARFANHPFRDKNRYEIHLAFEEIYADYMPGALSGNEYSEEQAKQRAQIGTKYGFEDVQYRLYKRTRSFSGKDYVALLGTYSDHIAIEEKTRAEFFSRIQKAVEEHGNELTLYDTIDLQLYRKP